MGSGDELETPLPRRRLPLLCPKVGLETISLKVDGWAKDRDPNTAFSTTVEPLPFHAMSYDLPYLPEIGSLSRRGATHEQYRKQYNTRPALKLIRPLGL